MHSLAVLLSAVLLSVTAHACRAVHAASKLSCCVLSVTAHASSNSINVWIMVITLHTDPEIWGPDSYAFNPNRFANGITGACKLPHLYMPFGVGPRVCLGQNFAMVELKVLIALIVSNFSFSLSPKYRHAPTLRLVVEPEHGVDLLVKKL